MRSVNINPSIRLSFNLALLVGLTSTGSSQSVANSSFEDNNYTSTGSSITNDPGIIDAWTVSSTGQAIISTTASGTGLVPPQTAVNGENFFSIANIDAGPNTITLSQTISGLVVGQQYQISFYDSIAVYCDDESLASSSWKVSLGSESFQKSSSLAGTPESALEDGQWNYNIYPWQHSVFTYTAQSASELMSFVGIASGDPIQIYLDNIVISEVPEPSSIAIAAVVVILAVAGRFYPRRRRVA